jgi:hypothetical protein
MSWRRVNRFEMFKPNNDFFTLKGIHTFNFTQCSGCETTSEKISILLYAVHKATDTAPKINVNLRILTLFTNLDYVMLAIHLMIGLRTEITKT